ncbi:MAG: cation diffusion facilitator family transporter, partial [Thermodesulfobacteriota bacterium]
LYKAETIATLVIAMAVLIAAYEIGKHAFLGPASIPQVGLALPVAFISFVVALVFGLVQQRAGRRLNSPALAADAKDYLADSLSTLVVLIGLLAGWAGFAIEKWVALVVALFVFRAGGQLLLLAIKDLLDVAMDRETEHELIAMIEAHPQIRGVNRCLSRTAGGRVIVEVDVSSRTPYNKMADQIAWQLENEISSKFPRIIMARVRTHYSRPAILNILTPMESPDGKPCSHLGGAPWFLLEKIEQASGEVVAREFIANPYHLETSKKGLQVGKWLLGLKPDVLKLEKEKESTVLSILREAGVEILVTGE